QKQVAKPGYKPENSPHKGLKGEMNEWRREKIVTNTAKKVQKQRSFRQSAESMGIQRESSPLPCRPAAQPLQPDSGDPKFKSSKT
ncbi:MAG: hypothetical protein AAF570_19750, partial [Bacteroidota bacterium]